MTLTSRPAEPPELVPDDPVVLRQQPLPPGVSQFGRQLRRADDVGEHQGREHPAWIEHRSNARHEVLDLGNDRVLIAGPDEVVGAGQLDVLGTRDVLGEIPPVRDAEAHGRLAVDDQRRDSDRRQDVPHIALVDEADDRLGAARRRRAPLVLRPRAADPLIAGDRRREQVDHHPAAGVALRNLERGRQLGDRRPDREVWRLEEPREAIDEDQARDPLGMGCREGHREDPTADVRDQRRPLGPDRVQHGRDVGHELLERRQRRGRDRVRQACPPLVEHDQPAERRQALPESCQRRHVPLGIEIAEPLVEEQDVGRPVANHLIREVQVAKSGVSRFRDHLLQG